MMMPPPVPGQWKSKAKQSKGEQVNHFKKSRAKHNKAKHIMIGEPQIGMKENQGKAGVGGLGNSLGRKEKKGRSGERRFAVLGMY